MFQFFFYYILIRAPLVGVESMPGTTQVITADSEGLFKLWDLRNYKCLQTFTRERTKGIASFSYVPKKDRIVCGVKSLKFFEQVKYYNFIHLCINIILCNNIYIYINCNRDKIRIYQLFRI